MNKSPPQLLVPGSSASSGQTGGLSTAAAQQLLHEHGPNALPQAKRRTLLRLIIGVLREPMFLLLVLASGLYLLIGSLGEGLLLAGFAALSIGLVVWQEARSENALDALLAMGAPFARVQRDGREQRIDARDLVPGDWLLISEGDRVAADARVLRCQGLALDESLLTGESVAVEKRSAAATDKDDEEAIQVYGGTLVVRGHGTAQVQSTGSQTRAGQIGVSLATIETGPTPLQQSTARLLRWFGLGALVVSLLVMLLYGWRAGDWLLGAQAGIAVAMSLLPEEFPMVLAIFLAMGAWRLARLHVLARRPAVVETLGAASVLCVDKTGTLTENRMRLRALVVGSRQVLLEGSETELAEEFHRLLEFGVLACKRQAVDPMDLALNRAGGSTLTGTEHLHGQWPLLREYGLSHERAAFSRAWQATDGKAILATKGAPEAIAQLCHLDAAASSALRQQVETLAAAGLRVLGVASGQSSAQQLPDDLAQLHLKFEGLLAFEDPMRSTAAAAVGMARQAGIRVVMITGDHPATALAIAKTAGIDVSGGVLTGSDLAELEDAALAQAVVRTSVYARIRPEQKLRLVHTYQGLGEVVAMTGDGVNDAPALKAAHIGMAIGSRATDVAREAAGIVLLEDDFGHVVEGIRRGRRIFDNLRKVMIYVVAIHVPIAGLALLPALLGLPPMLLPAHVVLIEMLIDPICSFAFENQPEEAGLMQRRPRRRSEALLAWPQLLLAALQGLLLLLVCLSLYWVLSARGASIEVARTCAFVALTVGNLLLVRVNATGDLVMGHLADAGQRPFWIIAVVASLIVGTCIALPQLATLFRFAMPSPELLLLSLAAGSCAVLLADLLKLLPLVQRSMGFKLRP